MGPNEKTRKKQRSYTAPEGRLPAVQTGDDALEERAPRVPPAAGSQEASSPFPAERERSDERRRVALFLIFAALLLAVVAYSFGGPHGRESRSEDLSSIGRERTVSEIIGKGKKSRPRTYEERVRAHRETVGAKLNRDRIKVQYDNLNLPVPNGARSSVLKDPVMPGLPMDAQKNQYGSLVPEGSRPARRLEDEVYGRVQLARDLDRWEIAAREEYIRQFKANARAHGYEVFIDKDYNVEWQPIEGRGPQSEVGR